LYFQYTLVVVFHLIFQIYFSGVLCHLQNTSFTLHSHSEDTVRQNSALSHQVSCVLDAFISAVNRLSA